MDFIYNLERVAKEGIGTEMVIKHRRHKISPKLGLRKKKLIKAEMVMTWNF